MAALQYGDQSITLAPSTNLSTLTDAITDAVRAGGGWIRVGLLGKEQLVFVSAGVSIRVTALNGQPAGPRVIAL